MSSMYLMRRGKGKKGREEGRQKENNITHTHSSKYFSHRHGTVVMREPSGHPGRPARRWLGTMRAPPGRPLAFPVPLGGKHLPERRPLLAACGGSRQPLDVTFLAGSGECLEWSLWGRDPVPGILHAGEGLGQELVALDWGWGPVVVRIVPPCEGGRGREEGRREGRGKGGGRKTGEGEGMIGEREREQ